MVQDDCIFCKLANGVFPTNKLFEDDDFTVILDASPANKGHALILPKQHYANLFEIDDEVSSKVLPLAKKIATALKEELGCDGINVVQNNGPSAGQTVFHFHMHLIPRYEKQEDDTTGVVDWEQRKIDPEEMKKICEEMKID